MGETQNIWLPKNQDKDSNDEITIVVVDQDTGDVITILDMPPIADHVGSSQIPHHLANFQKPDRDPERSQWIVFDKQEGVIRLSPTQEEQVGMHRLKVILNDG